MSNRQADVALVHGAGFEASGIASLYSLQQAELGAHLMEDGVVEQVVVCGRGPNTSDSYEFTEAQLMKLHLVRLGVDPELVHEENNSTNTLGNLVYGSDVVSGIGAESIIGVTRPSQKPRAIITARFVLPRAGLQLRGYEAIQGESIRPSSLVRESIQTPLLTGYLYTHRHDTLPELALGYRQFIDKTKLSTIKEMRYKKGSQRAA